MKIGGKLICSGNNGEAIWKEGVEIIALDQPGKKFINFFYRGAMSQWPQSPHPILLNTEE